MADNRPKLDQVNVIVSDMTRSLAFYRLLGVEVPDGGQTDGRHQHANAGSVEVDLDFDSQEFAKVWNQGWKGRSDLAGRVVVGFSVSERAEVDRLYYRLTAAGHRGLQPPWDAFWGARYAVVEDPDGLAIGLMSPVDPALRSAGPI
jgi:catechol 2,3-dioxygenase-like lactoylglutathione lyase family enzyme